MVDSRRTSRPAVTQTQAGPKPLRSSPKLAQGLSAVRRATLQEEIERGLVKEAPNLNGSALNRGIPEPSPTDLDRGLNRGQWMSGNQVSGFRKDGNDQALIAHSPSFIKNAAVSTGNSIGSTSGTSVERLAPEVYSPLWTMANLNLPRDRITVNSWIRNYFDLHPLVRNAITLHATYPISKLNLKCSDKKVLQEFEDMIEEMDLLGALGDIGLEFFKMGECVRENSIITTSCGPKLVKDVKVGDLVLTHKGRYCAVQKRLVNWEHSQVLRIFLRGHGIPIELSGNHPIFSIQGNNSQYMRKSLIGENGGVYFQHENEWNMKWVPASQLNIKDLVLLPIDRTVKDNLGMSKSWCRMLGLWLAEGCFDRNGTDCPRAPIISNFDDTVWNDYAKIFSECDMRLNKPINSGNGHLRSLAYGRFATIYEAQKIFRHAGEFCDQKVLSQDIMLLPPEKQLEIVTGFIDGDGWQHRGEICFGTTSKKLAIQMKQILARNWILATLSVDRRNERTSGKRKDLYVLGIPIMYVKRLATCSRLVGRLAEEIIKRPLKPNNVPRQKFSADGHILAYISKIETKTLPVGEPLYNFEVKDDNSYCVQGVTVHNCFPYAELDENNLKWKRIIIQNPDYILVKKMVLASEPVISLRPDAVLQRLVMSNNPADVQLRKQIPQNIIHHIRRGESIPLDNFNVSHLKMLSSPYDVRGTSIIVSIFKDLMLYDKLRECKFAQADDLVNPITLVKIGGSGEGEFHPDDAQLEYWRNIIEEGQYDKNYKIITHAAVAIERVGSSGAIIDISSDVELIIKNIMHGLMVPQAIIDTESAVYSSASIGLEVLRQRYFNFRNMLSKWLVNKIFAPISDLRGYYKAEGGFKKLIVPEIEWNQMNLYDLQDYISNISSLVTAKQVSLQTLYRSLGLNYEDERQKIRKEAISDAIRQREEQALASMSLTELRSLDPEREILEPTQAPQPLGSIPTGGVPGAPGMEAGMPPMGGGGGGMGGMPPIPVGGGGALPGGLPELSPPPGEMAGGIGGAPLGPPGGATPALGPGTVGMPGGK